ncbi:MAG: Ig-like domain-containing protein [Candidatus Eremiobacteraeota bacterium]|nr:Ig-like domain-containing protein [Candidatus Eremiobacteraeota bacterium]
MRVLTLGVLAYVFAAAPPGCTTTGQKPGPTPLPTVSPAIAGKLPSWITSVSPTGDAQAGSQIRVRFSDDVIPLDALESPDRQSALAHFTLAPALPGRFLFLTPRMVGFESDVAIPKATRLRVTISAGLSDLKGRKLESDYSWTYTTEKVALTGLPSDNEPVPKSPVFSITSNVALDEASLASHVRLVDKANRGRSDAGVPASVVHDASPSPTPLDQIVGPTPGDQSVTYALRPSSPLAGGTTYYVAVAPGVMPAAGNLATTRSYEGHFSVFGPLGFEGRTYTDAARVASRFTTGTPILRFSNGLDAASALKAVSVSPAPNPNVPLINIDDNSVEIRINSFALAPKSHYTFTVSTALKDRFGQTLAAPVTADADTGDLTPDIWAPTGFNAFPSSAGVKLNVETTNLKDGRYRSAYRTIEPQQLIDRDVENYDAAAKFLPPQGVWIATPAPNRPNQTVPVPIDVSAKLAGRGMLAYGFSARTGTSEPEAFTGIVQLTNVGIFAQWFPNGGVVRLAHLADGSPIPSATIDIYESIAGQSPEQRPAANLTPCASGRSDATGVWTIDGPTFARCASTAKTATDAPELLVIAREGTDWTYDRVWRYSGAYNNGMQNSGWSAGQPDPKGAILSDRRLYQPGETAQFAGIAYFDVNGSLVKGRSSAYRLTIQTPSGKKIALGARSLDAFGAFSFSYSLDKRAEVGFYSISASGDRGESLTGDFRVAEFKPPNFKVDLKLDRDAAAAGTSVSAQSTSSYLFGAPVEGGKTHYYVTRSNANYRPTGFDQFDFGRIWDYPEEPPSVEPDVLQKDVPLGPDGKATLAVSVGNDLPFPMSYRVDAETTDASNLTVADSKTFTAFPSDALIGLAGDFVATAGKPFNVMAVVVDTHGKAVSGRKMTVTLQLRTFGSATQIVEGSATAKDSVHYTDAGSVEATSGESPVAVPLKAGKPGWYRVRANFSGGSNDATATDHDVWITGEGAADWGSDEENKLVIKLDKKKYAPGETATALLQSPYDEADLYFAVVRHGVLYQTVQHVRGAAPQVKFTVGASMLPNAAVEGVLVRRGAPLSKGVPHGLTKLARIGFAPFNVALDAKYLKISLAPQRATLEPGASQHVALRLTDKNGKPVAGELTVAVVNDAVLQLTGYRFPDLVQIVYADQPISTRWADNRALVKLKPDARYMSKGNGYGGGASAALAGTRVRTQFKPFAYWNASLKTDASGNASADFTLPDDLTTWRVLALAMTADARFGNGEATFIASKPLVTNPLLPQFARPGDRFSIGVAITNTQRTKADVTIQSSLGGDLRFAGDNSQTKTVQAPLDAFTQAYRFDVLAGARDSAVTFKTALGSATDAFSLPLTIRTADVTETVATSGATSANSTSVPLDVPAFGAGPLGALDVTVANTLLAEMTEPQKVLDEDRQPFAVSIASRIAIAADGILLAQHFKDPNQKPARSIPRLSQSLAADLEALERLATTDGGYAAWPGAAKSDTFTTGFVATQLAQARLAGANPAGIAHAKKFLEGRLADPSIECKHAPPACYSETRLEASETLASLGEPRSDFLSDMWRDRDTYGYVERAELARMLLKLPAWHDRGIELRDKLNEQVYETARRATVNEPYGWFETPVASQAQMASLLIESNAPGDRTDNAVRSLLASRGKNGRWLCACDDAEALNALVAYAFSPAGRPRDFGVDVVAGALNRHADLMGTSHSAQNFTYALGPGDVPAGKTSVALTKHGDGTLHYDVALRYRAPDAQGGVYSGIRIDRRVHLPNDPAIVAQFGLAQVAPDATHVTAGRVYEIEDRITSDHALDNVVIVDPLAAGLEAVDTSFKTATQYFQARSDSWQIDYQAVYKDRVLSFARRLPAGVYAVRYLVRTVTPGSFSWPGATVSMQFAPEEFGRTASSRLTIDPAK